MNRSCSTPLYSPPHRLEGLVWKKRPTSCLPPLKALTGLRHALCNLIFTVITIIVFSYLIPRQACLISVRGRFEGFYADQSAFLRTTMFASISSAQIIFGPTSLLFGQHRLQYDNLSPPLCSPPLSPTLNGPQRNPFRVPAYHMLRHDHQLLPLSITSGTVSQTVLSRYLTQTTIFNFDWPS